jgi:hypothetical protein
MLIRHNSSDSKRPTDALNVQVRQAFNFFPHRRQKAALSGILSPQLAQSSIFGELLLAVFIARMTTKTATMAIKVESIGKSKNTFMTAK